MNQQQRAKWERTRAKGMWRFVLLCWVIFGGAMMITGIFLYRWDQLRIVLPIYFVSGLVFGLVCWFVGEHQYRKSSHNTASR